MLLQKSQRSVGKRSSQAVTVATVTGPPQSRLFFVFDNANDLQFLVDTGAEISVIPPDPKQRDLKPFPVTLRAANNSVIPTYGQRLLTLDLGLRRQFSFVFTIAQVQHPIFGIDFYSIFTSSSMYVPANSSTERLP